VKRKLGLATTAGALAVALTLVLTACGGNGDSDGVASLTDTTTQSTTEGGEGSAGGSGGASDDEREEAALEYAQCMREHGIDFPDPVNGRFEFRQSADEDPQKMQEAQEACQDILERVAPPPLDEEEQAELRKATLEFSKCMREHGVDDFPDPQFEEGGGVLMQLPEGTEDDPQFEEAQETCQPILDAVQPDGPSAQGEGT
jgi:uncharacterized protein (DUF885 family)